MDSIKKIFYINLNRSKYRNDMINEHLSKFDIPFERFTAVDGNELNDSDKCNKFVVARHHTEMRLLKYISNLDEGLYLINEDDILIEENFFEKLHILLGEIPDDWQILKIGSHTLYNAISYEPIGEHIKGTKISDHLYKLTNGIDDGAKNLGQQCYIIRHVKNNVQSIINNLEQLTLYHIDHNYNKIMNNINIYSTKIDEFIFFKQLPVPTTIHLY